MACDVVAHTEARLPLMAEAMWGNRQGCFEKPCPERPPRVHASNNLELYTLQHSIAWGICKRYVGHAGLCPRYGGVFQ